MGKPKIAEVLSLDTTKQKEVVKETKQLKKKIKEGTISVREVRKSQKITAEQSRGLIYIAHLPHGFYEEELKNFFKQFGKVTNVKVCRSSRTGRSKGYAYLEFTHPEVAKIAAETMNNYLMFKKRITAEFVPYENRPKGLFIGKATTLERFSSKIRRQKQRQANAKLDEETLLKRTKFRLARLNNRLGRLKKLGVKTTYTPENLVITKLEDKPSVKQTKNSNKVIHVSSRKSSGPLKSPKSTKSLPETTSTKKLKTVSKPKSLPSLKSSNKNLEKGQYVKKIVVETSSVALKKNSKNKGKLTNKGVTKKSKKPALPLKSETIKKIAKEFIKKRGDTLLTYPVTKTKKKSPKK